MLIINCAVEHQRCKGSVWSGIAGIGITLVIPTPTQDDIRYIKLKIFLQIISSNRTCEASWEDFIKQNSLEFLL